uniref:(California timema) hypothetical protein n=1 Tax=Timema californicum TaxID=61474 RepID=A0A7R9JDS6_TIMCA|nr:unnamed protein product [Timema californicum]
MGFLPRKKANVMTKLADIAHNAVCKTGVFQSKSPYYNQDPLSVLGQPTGKGPRLQTGVVRVNCVDCLDRTNTAQFAFGKCALGFQLCALGVLNSPLLEFDTDCVRMLEELYEDHGDTLALQYGGSQLVHRIKTYRKTAPWTSQGNDIMQTLSRYYSNTFSDAEKQHTINLFLGLFVPDESQPPIWDQLTDYYLHHSLAMGLKSTRWREFLMKDSKEREGDWEEGWVKDDNEQKEGVAGMLGKYPSEWKERVTGVLEKRQQYNLKQWWDTEVLQCLPQAHDEVSKTCREVALIVRPQDESVDGYQDYHRPHELTVLGETFAFEISHSVRDFMPHFTTSYSPFAVRVRPGRRREETSSKGNSISKNPSLTGQSSTSSTTSSASESSSEESEEELDNSDSQISPSKDSTSDNVTFEALFPSMRRVYGTEVKNPSKQDIAIYKRYVSIGISANSIKPTLGVGRSVNLIQQSVFSMDTSVRVSPPRASRCAQESYHRYVERGLVGASEPSPSDLLKYNSLLCLCANRPVPRLTLSIHIGSNTDAKSNVLIGQESTPKPPTPLKDHRTKYGHVMRENERSVGWVEVGKVEKELPKKSTRAAVLVARVIEPTTVRPFVNIECSRVQTSVKTAMPSLPTYLQNRLSKHGVCIREYPLKRIEREQVNKCSEVFITSNKGEDTKAIQAKLISSLNPAKDRILIRSIRPAGRSVVVETEADTDKVRAGVQTLEGLKCEAPRRRKPLLTIFDVPVDMEVEELKEAIYSQNLEVKIDREEFLEGFEPRFRTGRRERKVTNHVVEVSPRVRNQLVNSRVYLRFTSVSVKDFLVVTRCHRCMDLGHKVKFCPKKESVCGSCGQTGHERRECKEKVKRCIPCHCRGKDKCRSPNGRECPTYQLLDRQVQDTQYNE